LINIAEIDEILLQFQPCAEPLNVEIVSWCAYTTRRRRRTTSGGRLASTGSTRPPISARQSRSVRVRANEAFGPGEDEAACFTARREDVA
jgi:hypothetical protein